MTQDLLLDMFYAAPELWYILLTVFLVLLGALLYARIKILKLTQKNYFINRDRERYAETLYASKDGYFAFIYPDEKVNDPQTFIKERCSRRLAVLLNLPKGTSSRFIDVLECFEEDDAKWLQKNIRQLQEDGVSFEEAFVLKNGQQLVLTGARINGSDGNLYCDMIWFRDNSKDASKINFLKNEKESAIRHNRQLEEVLNNLPYPVWLRDEQFNLTAVNKKYLELVNSPDKWNVIEQQTEIPCAADGNLLRELAQKAQKLNRTQKQTINVIKDGQSYSFENWESPFQASEKNMVVGTLIDVTELDNLKRNLQLHQNAHWDILGTLGTAFAVFDGNRKLSFYNKAFASLWHLTADELENDFSYNHFLECLREKQLLPEVPDFRLYMNDELKAFNEIIETKEDMLHLPNGNTIRRVRLPHPMGGLVFAFEDVSDRLATRRAYNALIQVQEEILNNLFEAVIIFGSNGRLKAYNQAYLSLWNLNELFLQKEPSISELLEEQKPFFNNVENWEELKEDIIAHLANTRTKTFVLTRNDGVKIEIRSSLLSDGSVVIASKKI